ncbi:hypothetical protein [Microbulbifer elongatus]|uniref:hypothetical protein n=1 Tax=Microbulbifer elongatus TaxID=86173 RepID=UPI001E3DE0CC|nr:hypothetical protein [Microbulbifer elongatus]
MRSLLILFAVMIISACTEKSGNPHIEKAIYTDNFAGLVEVGKNYNESKFDYELDTKNGSAIQFQTCEDIKQTKVGEIREDQFSLFTMLNVNCEALQLYFSAGNSRKSFFPPVLTSELIQQLPANATPDLGGDPSPVSNQEIAQAFPNSEIVEISPTVVRSNLAGLDIDYTLLARGDLDGDGTEDLIVRMDWNNPNAFGNGYEMLLIGANELRTRLLKSPTH